MRQLPHLQALCCHLEGLALLDLLLQGLFNTRALLCQHSDLSLLAREGFCEGVVLSLREQQTHIHRRAVSSDT